MISIIIPVYNSDSYLDECIKSVLCQTYQDFELILVDDGSTDHSLEILQRWESKDDRINLIVQENSGASSARNHGLNEAKGEWVVFIDSDDIVSPNYLLDLYEATQKDSNIDLCIDGVSVYRDGKWNEDWRFPEKICSISDAVFLFGEIKLHKYGFSVGKLYRREIIENNNLKFDVKVCIAEDMMFMVNYIMKASQKKTSKVAFIDKCNYLYFIRQGSLSTSSSAIENELYSYHEYRRIINQLFCLFDIVDNKIKLIMISPIVFYADRCLNAIFQRPISPEWRDKLCLIDREEYNRYKRCNSWFESVLKFLFVHRFWCLLRLVR